MNNKSSNIFFFFFYKSITQTSRSNLTYRPSVRLSSTARNNYCSFPFKASTHLSRVFSFDVRGRPLAHALKWSSDEDHGGFGPRASFVVFGGGPPGKWSARRTAWLDGHVGGAYDNSSKAALRVVNVTEQDAGSYRCRVDFRDSPTRNYRIILQVTGEPK